MESVDNPDIDIFNIQLDRVSLENHFDSTLLGGTTVISAKSTDSRPLTLIPYHLWAQPWALPDDGLDKYLTQENSSTHMKS